MGGTLLTAGLEWASFFFGSMCLPPDPTLVGDSWRAMWLERLQNIPLFFELWLQHQRRDAYWKHGSVCENYKAIQCPVYAVGGWTDAYKNAIPRLLKGLMVPRKGLIGPWAHGYPHFALPGPQIGFLQEMLRWWDYWLKGVDTGVMDELGLRAWMTESVKPASHHDTLPGRWIAERSWPSSGIAPRRLFLTDEGLRDTPAPGGSHGVLAADGWQVCRQLGSRRGHDQAGDQQEDDMRSLLFETPPLDAPIEMLGAAIATIDVASDRPIANLVVRLCDVHPSGESLRVTLACSTSRIATGTNILHSWRSESATACASSSMMRLGIPGRPQGEARDIDGLLADDWPLPEKATMLIFAGISICRTPAAGHGRAALAIP